MFRFLLKGAWIEWSDATVRRARVAFVSNRRFGVTVVIRKDGRRPATHANPHGRGGHGTGRPGAGANAGPTPPGARVARHRGAARKKRDPHRLGAGGDHRAARHAVLRGAELLAGRLRS